jgi:hypothetical protein
MAFIQKVVFENHFGEDAVSSFCREGITFLDDADTLAGVFFIIGINYCNGC